MQKICYPQLMIYESLAKSDNQKSETIIDKFI